MDQPGRSHAGFVGHICKRAVAVVVIENAAVVAGHVEINPAIAIVVRRRRAHAENVRRDASALSVDLSKRAVMIVVIERALQRFAGRIKSDGPLLTR